ncbi:MAG: alpha-hydroxy-acid oxidizing protein [Chloroflexi bacterium]|nr:alpha-hydroxy-acid oxidizing protein [Chloroflexota bacterium]
MDVSIEDLRQRARRRLPRALFDFVDGGGEDEVTLRENRTAFERITFRPRALVDVSRRDQRTTVLGQSLSTPIVLAPAGMPGLLWPRGEIEAARAAAHLGTIYTLPTRATCAIEDVADATRGHLWFQVYVWKDREYTRRLVERAAAVGAKAMFLTVDVQVVSQRERDLRNGFTVPPKVTIANALDTLRRVTWMRRVLMGPKITDRNFLGLRHAAGGSDLIKLGGYVTSLHDQSVSWDDFRWFRSLWSGPLVVKGIVTAEDARRAVDLGADGVVVSNHGGRQLDYLPTSVEALPEVVDAVGHRVDVLLDSGIRRGSDAVKALALGAKACMIGRPYLWGLAVDGQAGAERAIEILRAEIDRTQGLLGRPTLADLDRSALRLDPALARESVVAG